MGIISTQVIQTAFFMRAFGYSDRDQILVLRFFDYRGGHSRRV